MRRKPPGSLGSEIPGEGGGAWVDFAVETIVGRTIGPRSIRHWSWIWAASISLGSRDRGLDCRIRRARKITVVLVLYLQQVLATGALRMNGTSQLGEHAACHGSKLLLLSAGLPHCATCGQAAHHRWQGEGHRPCRSLLGNARQFRLRPRGSLRRLTGRIYCIHSTRGPDVPATRATKTA